MAGILADVLGSSVTYSPRVGSPVVVQSIFREEPIEVVGGDGRPVLITSATWRAPRDQVQGERGDTILLLDGRRFRIMNQAPTGSPAADAFTIYEMELVA